jgi:uncharacterized coiled-coil protein SlyX
VQEIEVLMLQVAATDRASNREKATQTLDSSEMVLLQTRLFTPIFLASSHSPQQSLRNRITGAVLSLFSSLPFTRSLLMSLAALEAELLLGNAARSAAEGDIAKLRKELAVAAAAASAASAAKASVHELQLAMDSLQSQLDSERRRLQQLDHDYIQSQQQEQALLAKIASMLAAEKLRESEQATAISELRQQLQQQQNGMRSEVYGGQQLSRMASVEHSLSEGELAQQVMGRISS